MEFQKEKEEDWIKEANEKIRQLAKSEYESATYEIFILCQKLHLDKEYAEEKFLRYFNEIANH